MATPHFDHEKLHVYCLALDFMAWVTPLLAEIKSRAAAESSTIRDHLDRASLSTVLNIAEGNGKFARRSRKSFFDIARGSATECAACLDSLVAKGVVRADEIIIGKEYLIRIVQMLTKMIIALGGEDSVGEELPEYHVDTE